MFMSSTIRTECIYHPTLQSLDGEEEEKRIYYLSRSERRYTNFSKFRCHLLGEVKGDQGSRNVRAFP